jgi:peroxiredoxin family protein
VSRVAAIVTTADPDRLAELAAACGAAARAGAEVRVFFRDESIPAIIRVEAAHRQGIAPGPDVADLLAELLAAGSVRLYACSSSLYLWGVSAEDLLPLLSGPRGLVAFLAEDVDGASEVLSF